MLAFKVVMTYSAWPFRYESIPFEMKEDAEALAEGKKELDKERGIKECKVVECKCKRPITRAELLGDSKE